MKRFNLLLALTLSMLVFVGCSELVRPDGGSTTQPSAADKLIAAAPVAGAAANVLLPPPFGELASALIAATATWFVANRKKKSETSHP